MSGADQTPELSRIVAIDALGDNGRVLSVEATAGELEAVARRLGLEGLASLSGSARVIRTGRGRYRADIDFRADVLQSCVVTLEPVPAQVSDAGSVWFEQDGKHVDDFDVLDLEAPDPPEPLDDGRIDVGELIVQHLALALDPYPRAEGVTLADVLQTVDETVEDEDGDGQESAFSVLGKLKGP